MNVLPVQETKESSLPDMPLSRIEIRPNRSADSAVGRKHVALDKGTPARRAAVGNHELGARTIAIPNFGGVHHRYDLTA